MSRSGNGLTVKQAAQVMNVSVRMVYDAIKLQKIGSAELCQAVMDGRVSLHRALKAARSFPQEQQLEAALTK